MKRVTPKCLLPALVCVLALFNPACNDPGRVMDTNTEIPGHNWAYANNIKYNVNIPDAGAAYNLYFNIRVTGEYKYSNMFVLLHTSGPGLKAKIARYEIPLASPDGEWLGSGSGNLYSRQIIFAANYHFPAPGVYHFEIEQNMRDNPLRQVSDIGMRIEKVQQH